MGQHVSDHCLLGGHYQKKMSNVDEGVKKLKPLCPGGNIRWYSYYEKQNGGFSKNYKEVN